MEELQAALDRSMRATSEQTRAFFEDPWTAAQVAEFVNAQRNVTIATSGVSGWPHAAVVIAACLDGVIHFTVTRGSVLGRNIASNERIGFSVSDRSHAVMGQGRARRVGAALEIPDNVAALGAATTSASFSPPGWDGDIYAIEVSRIFAN